MTNGWIPCFNELPDGGLAVMTYSPESCEPVWPAFRENDGWMGIDGFPLQMEVTHWMNFPEPPQEGA